MRKYQILALLVFLSSALACTPPEQTTLSEFVTAVQSGNETAVNQVSLVESPSEFSTWEIGEIGPESSEPFQLIELLDGRAATVQELEATMKANDTYLQENEELYLKYKPLKDKDAETAFTGELAAFDEEYSARMEKQKGLNREISQTGRRIDEVKKAAALSTRTPGITSGYDGDVKAKEAQLKLDDTDYTVTLKLYALIHTEHQIEPMARWIITDIRE
jgi:hypothetical protein